MSGKVSVEKLIKEVNAEMVSVEEADRVRSSIESYIKTAIRNNEDYIYMEENDHKIAVRNGIIDKDWYCKERKINGTTSFHVYFRNCEKARKSTKKEELISSAFWFVIIGCLSCMVCMQLFI